MTSEHDDIVAKIDRVILHIDNFQRTFGSPDVLNALAKNTPLREQSELMAKQMGETLREVRYDVDTNMKMYPE